ncbi:MAG: amidohydrolase family protein [Armatimonadetes bacterium]|nr:amidohydrolase family protein [Armatimonadota bacterium]
MVTSQIAQKCLRGEPLEEYVVDAHCHLGPWHNFFVRRGGWADAVVEAMDRCGVTVSIIAAHVAVGPDEREGNNQVYRAAEAYPGRLVPYVTINPNRGTAAVEAEIARWEPHGIRAFKIHPSTHQYPVSGDNYRPMFEYAAAHALPVLSHTWAGDPNCSPPAFAQLAAQYPKAYFIIGHAASSWDAINAGCQAAVEYPNVYLDLCGSAMHYGALEYMVAQVGAERILHGSDNPFLDPRPPLGRVLMARITDDQKRLILGLNAKQLFQL